MSAWSCRGQPTPNPVLILCLWRHFPPVTFADHAVCSGVGIEFVANMAANLFVPAGIFIGLSFICVLLRLYARVFLVQGLAGDDYLIVAAFVSALDCVGRPNDFIPCH